MDTLKLRDGVSLGEVTSSPAQASFDSWQCRGSCQGSRTDRQMCQNRQPEWQSLLGAVMGMAKHPCLSMPVLVQAPSTATGCFKGVDGFGLT